MAVTKSDLDPKVLQCPKTLLMAVRKMSLESDLVAEMLLMLKKKIRPDYSRTSLRYDRPRKCATILYGINTRFHPQGLEPHDIQIKRE